MGIGEPLANLSALLPVLQTITEKGALGPGARRLTMSTVGLPDIIRALADPGTPYKRAVSRLAPHDPLRNDLVPLNRKYPIAELMQACRDYPAGGNTRRITFEYIMLNGVNDSPAQARALVKLIAGIPAKVNLIPFNPWPGAPYLRSTDEAIAAFAAIVNKAGYSSPVRVPRGEDIMAACGQLKSASERVKKARKTGASTTRS